RDAIELAVLQTVVRRPRLTAIDRYRRALIDSREHPFRVRRIDPEESGIGAARRAPERRDVTARVDRAVDGGAHQVHLIRILRIGVNLSAGAGQLPRPERPALASIVRAVERASACAATAGSGDRVQPSAMRAGRNRERGNARAVRETTPADRL